MRKTLFLFLTCLTIGLVSVAQCDKKITWTASKGEFVSSSGNVEQTINEKIIVEMDKKQIVLKHNDQEEDALTGEIKELTCEWKVPYKNGKTSFKSQLAEPNGDVKNATVTIEGIDGKILITVDVTDPSGSGDNKKIKIYVDSYKES